MAPIAIFKQIRKCLFLTHRGSETILHHECRHQRLHLSRLQQPF
jgi:hypothetical protein